MTSYSFAIPYSNVIVLLFPSPPIQSAQTSYKVGLFIGRIEQSGQTIPRGPVSLVLQIKEFLYSYLSIPDRMIGSLFYSTTGLHGAHATLGMPHFYLIPSMILSDSLSSSTRSSSNSSFSFLLSIGRSSLRS